MRQDQDPWLGMTCPCYSRNIWISGTNCVSTPSSRDAVCHVQHTSQASSGHCLSLEDLIICHILMDFVRFIVCRLCPRAPLECQSNTIIGLVPIVETDSNIDGSVHSKQPGESIITESDMSNARFSNISPRSVVDLDWDLDWDIDEPEAPHRNGPIALMGGEAILHFISDGLE
jgi:hypothetical protein